MPPPNDATHHFASGISISRVPTGISPSMDLVHLLIQARNAYDWPAGTGAAASQARIIALEASVSHLLLDLTPASAHCIVQEVSDWAGNNARSQRRLVAATPIEVETMQAAITALSNPATARSGIDALSVLPGLSLVISSKIYRFCCPLIGAAVDRHASYFFNSLLVVGGGRATQFHREWSNGPGGATRLATYNAAGLAFNTTVYFQEYLPLLKQIADYLNSSGRTFKCASTGVLRKWTPAHVEMAAYYWWALHGAR